MSQHDPHRSAASLLASGRKAGTLFALALALAAPAGCTPTENAPDTVDMGMTTNYTYTPATIAQINADSGNGMYGNGQRISLDRVVAVTDVDKYVNSTNVQCRYQIWIQDATCTTPPCGMVVKGIGPMAPSATASGSDCPSARLSGTPLISVKRGDNIRVKGKIIVEIDSTAPSVVVEHQLFADTLEILDEAQSITPLVISDPMVYTQFQTHLGKTWNKYEGMYVTIQPPNNGVLTVSKFSSSGFQTTPGPIEWSDAFDNDYYPTGVTMFPTMGATFHAISGVVSTRHGGEIMPVRNKDFAP